MSELTFKNTEACTASLLKDGTVRHLALRVGCRDRVLFDLRRSADATVVDDRTLFDVASLTKILSVTMLALRALDDGRLKLSDRISRFYPDAGVRTDLTVLHFLTHRIGVGHAALNREGNTYENIAGYILRLIPENADSAPVAYSCPAYILLGKMLEQLYGMRLDRAFLEYVAEPLGLRDSCFCPDTKKYTLVNSNPEPEGLGFVNDYNSRFLGGIAGNAGLFSDIRDLTVFAELLTRRLRPYLSEAMYEAAARHYCGEGEDSRALGFLYVDGVYEQTADLFPAGSLGHCGHTGQSLFADPESGLYVIVLSDATVSLEKKGITDYGAVKAFRRGLHHAIKTDLDANGFRRA